MIHSNQFLKLTTSSLLPKSFTILISLILFSFITACNPQDNIIAPNEKMSGVIINTTAEDQLSNLVLDSNSTLKSVAPFPIGAAFSSNIITRNPKAYNLFLSQFNSKTVHAYMNVEPTQGQFNFKEVDYWVNLAQTNPMRLNGHCLVYHIGAPDWITNFSGNTSSFEKAVKNHIQTVVGRYKSKIKGWDVMNELFDNNTGNFRQTPFRQLYPSEAAYMEFVKQCFEWAHEADPDASLFYTDFGYESYPAKLKAALNMVADFKRSGIPIHGVCTHMHININTSDNGISNSLHQLSSTGLQVHISELDIAINPKNDQTLVFSKELLDLQRLKYQRVVVAYKKIVPASQQYGITLWSFCDGDSWLVTVNKQLDQPNIFDKKFEKKPAYYGLLVGLKQ